MHWHLLATILGLLLGVVLVARVLGQREAPSVTVAWILAIVFVPWVGVPLYLLVGTRKLRGTLARQRPLYALTPRGAIANDDRFGIDRLLAGGGHPPTRAGHRVELAANGEDAWRRLEEAIAGAKRSIWICTFQLKLDPVARAFVHRLTQRAKEGVEVCLLMDGMGSWRTRRRFTKRLRREGGRVAVFRPVWPLALPWSANLRNHRKSVVVDGRVAFVGGMNVGSCYMGPTPDKDRWIDLLAEVEGPAVADVAAVFCRDWEVATSEVLAPPPAPAPAGAAPLRILASGPDVAGDPLSDVLALGIVGARERVWVMTPYLVPDDTILHLLQLAARSGVDVRLVLPEKSDHLLADLARGHALRRLAAAGARILVHPSRMLHAKAFLLDDDLGLVGSANLDRRSLFLNHELTVLLQGPEQVADLAAWTQRIMARCVPWTPRPESALRGLVEDVTGILAPLV